MKKWINTLLSLLIVGTAWGQNATEIVRKADAKMRGESSKGELKMIIKRPTWERTIEFKSWSLSTEYSMTLVTAPAKEEGQVFLKRQNEIWQWNPTINRMIKLPPSMMSQGWMGSDYSMDNVVKESSIVKDYNHKILGTETINGYETYKIELMPLEDAAVIWGKIIVWISKDDYLQLKAQYFDEDDELVRTDISSNVQVMDGRKIPTRFEIIPADEKNQKTILTIQNMQFNVDLSPTFFTQQNMKRLR
ncbi:MAG: outer membrane lipoprotein-sorting protein [Bacteroidota bacterium]